MQDQIKTIQIIEPGIWCPHMCPSVNPKLAGFLNPKPMTFGNVDQPPINFDQPAKLTVWFDHAKLTVWFDQT